MTIDIIRQQQDDQDPGRWYFKIGGLAGDGFYRLADLSEATPSPAAWVAAHPVEAQAAIEAGVYHEAYVQRMDLQALGQQAQAELDYLAGVIGAIDGMAAGEVRSVVKRLAMENVQLIRAMRYVVRRLAE